MGATPMVQDSGTEEPDGTQLPVDAPWPRALAFGKQVRELRGQRSLEAFGKLASISISHLSMIERGRARPSRRLVQRVDEVCQTGGRLLTAFPLLLDEWAAKRDALRRRAATETTGSAVSAGSESGARRDSRQAQYDEDEMSAAPSGAIGQVRHRASGKEAAATKRRAFVHTAGALLAGAAVRSSEFLRWIEQSNVGPFGLDDLEEHMWWIAERNYALPPVLLLEDAEATFAEVAGLLGGRHSSRDRARLEFLAGGLSYHRANLAFRLGDHVGAQSHARIARYYGELLDHHLLLGSTASLESAIAFYRGDYARARDAARAGQRFAIPHTAAKLLADDARACASLGDIDAARLAIEQAKSLLDPAPTIHAGGTPPFPPEKLSMYESLVAVRARDPRADALSREAVQRYRLLRGRGGVEDAALAQLNLATALASGRRPDPDQAARIGVEALGTRPELQTDPVRRRGLELRQALAGWNTRAATREFAEVLRDYQPRGELPPPKPGTRALTRRAE